MFFDGSVRSTRSTASRDGSLERRSPGRARRATRASSSNSAVSIEMRMVRHVRALRSHRGSRRSSPRSSSPSAECGMRRRRSQAARRARRVAARAAESSSRPATGCARSARAWRRVAPHERIRARDRGGSRGRNRCVRGVVQLRQRIRERSVDRLVSSRHASCSSPVDPGLHAGPQSVCWMNQSIGFATTL